jgi:hypothetical protein
MPASSEASRALSRESRVSALPGHPSRTTSGTVRCVFHGFLPPNPWEGSRLLARHCQLNAKIDTFVQEQEEQGLVGTFMNPWILALQRGTLRLGGQGATRDFH